jgi:hypothetical protein
LHLETSSFVDKAHKNVLPLHQHRPISKYGFGKLEEENLQFKMMSPAIINKAKFESQDLKPTGAQEMGNK